MPKTHYRNYRNEETVWRKTSNAKRRTDIGDAPVIDVPVEAFIEKEPITVICSEKGWIKAAKGHLEDGSDVKYKDGDRGKFSFHAETTDKLSVATNERFTRYHV